RPSPWTGRGTRMRGQRAAGARPTSKTASWNCLENAARGRDPARVAGRSADRPGDEPVLEETGPRHAAPADAAGEAQRPARRSERGQPFRVVQPLQAVGYRAHGGN